MTSSAQFTGPTGITVDRLGNLYVTDSYNNTIRKITSLGVVTTLGGDASLTDQNGLPVSGNLDAVGTLARFNFPTGIAVDKAGTLFIADTANNIIRKGVPRISTSPPVFTLKNSRFQNGSLKTDLILSSGLARSWVVLQAPLLGGAWFTNTSSIVTTNVYGATYQLMITAPPSLSNAFFRVLAQ